MVGAVLMATAGLALACTSNLLLLIIAGTKGVINPSGNQVDPFLSIEQAALSHVVPDRSRTEVFAWYTMAGSVATALGALFGGMMTRVLDKTMMTPVGMYPVVVVLYALVGVLLAALFVQLSPVAEAHSPEEVSALPRTMNSFLRRGPIASRCGQTFEPVRLGLVRWRFCSAEFRRVFVLASFWRNPVNARGDFLLAKHLCGDFRTTECPARCTLGAH
jgi:MFS family permease